MPRTERMKLQHVDSVHSCSCQKCYKPVFLYRKDKNGAITNIVEVDAKDIPKPVTLDCPSHKREFTCDVCGTTLHHEVEKAEKPPCKCLKGIALMEKTHREKHGGLPQGDWKEDFWQEILVDADVQVSNKQYKVILVFIENLLKKEREKHK